MEYLQYTFEGLGEEQKEMMVAMLGEIGFEGFEEEDQSLKAFIPGEKFDLDSFNAMVEINDVKYSRSVIKETNWNEKWEADFQPVVVTHPVSSEPFVYMRAKFHEPNPAYQYDLLVTPKMSFGTGHHATTYLMVSQMSQIDFEGKRVIDFGTGTGVLAILAEKMGADTVVAIDYDEWSINNAKENLEENGCTKTILVQADTIPFEYKADIILANINLNVILANIRNIKDACYSDATVLFSGIMLHDEAQILKELTNANFEIKEVFRKENWIAILTVLY